MQSPFERIKWIVEMDMMDIEQAMAQKFPNFAKTLPIIKKPTISLLKKLVNEQQINQFLSGHQHLLGFDFVDQTLDFFQCSFSVSAADKRNIPAEGRVIIIANHPVGSLDSLALLQLIGEVRRDVKIVPSPLLSKLSNLSSLMLTRQDDLKTPYQKSMVEHLHNDGAIIVFPAEKGSRPHPTGFKDGRWRSHFLNIARSTESPILPVRIKSKNSILSYGASAIFRPLGAVMMAHETLRKRARLIHFFAGELIDPNAINNTQVRDKALLSRLRKHLYRLGRRGKSQFETLTAIAHPESARDVSQALQKAILLGKTRDGNSIYLADASSPSLMREIGRLREVTFRKVGEGTGTRRDLDRFDGDYQHLVLWNDDQLEIVGSYRIGPIQEILDKRSVEGVYTNTLFEFSSALMGLLPETLELGRSFVVPKYWGKASLDYLWQGIGCYLKQHPQVRYVMGPVTISADFPQGLTNELVCYYETFFSSPTSMAIGKMPYVIDPVERERIRVLYDGLTADKALHQLQLRFTDAGYKMPVLFKQYAALYEQGGFKLLAFNVDPDFANCIDGLFIADLTKMKANKRKRYIGE